MSLADMGTATRSAGGGGGGSRHYDLNNAGGGGGGGGGGSGMAGSGLPGGRMTHSLSTPSGVDGTPSTPRHRGGKKLTVRIQMLDDSVTMFQVQVSAGSLEAIQLKTGFICGFEKSLFCVIRDAYVCIIFVILDSEILKIIC